MKDLHTKFIGLLMLIFLGYVAYLCNTNKVWLENDVHTIIFIPFHRLGIE